MKKVMRYILALVPLLLMMAIKPNNGHGVPSIASGDLLDSPYGYGNMAHNTVGNIPIVETFDDFEAYNKKYEWRTTTKDKL